jgi:hypothetical protein
VVNFKVQYEDFPSDPTTRDLTQHRYARLVVSVTSASSRSSAVTREKVVRMSSNVAQVLVQTDKQMYRRGDVGEIRSIRVDKILKSEMGLYKIPKSVIILDESIRYKK